MNYVIPHPRIIEKFDPDQPRDDAGRWTDGFSRITRSIGSKFKATKDALAPLARKFDIRDDVKPNGKRIEQVPGKVDPRDNNIHVPYNRRNSFCYVYSAKFIMDNPDIPGIKLVHGHTQISDSVEPINHSWVEFGNKVFEPNSGHTMTMKQFEKFFHPTREVSWTPDEVKKHRKESRHYGPWHEDIGKNGFNPNQPRNPKTGEWVDTIPNKITTRRMGGSRYLTNTGHSIEKITSDYGTEWHVTKVNTDYHETFDTKADAMHFLLEDIKNGVTDAVNPYDISKANPLWDGDGVQGIGQPRDWHGRWMRVRLPGASKFSHLSIIKESDNEFRVYRDNKTDKDHLVRTFKTRKGATNFVEKEMGKDKEDKAAYRRVAGEEKRKQEDQKKHSRYQHQRAQKEREALAQGVRSEERDLARPEGRRPARNPQPRDWQGDTPVFRANVSEVDRIELPGTPSPSQVADAEKWIAKTFAGDVSERKYAGLILRLMKKGISQDPRRRGQINEKYEISPKRQTQIEHAIYDHIFPPKVETKQPRKRNLRGVGGRLPSRQRDAMLEQGALRGIPLAAPESVFEPDRLFKATKGKNKGKWVIVNGKGDSRVVSEKRAAKIVNDSHDWWTAHNARQKEEQERKNRNRREEQKALNAAERSGIKAEKERKVLIAQKWAEENNLDPSDSYWWGFYWNDPSLITDSMKLGQDLDTETPIKVGLPDVQSGEKMDPGLLESILALPDIDARDIRGHKPRGKKAIKGDEDFVEATPEQRRTSPEQEARNRDRQIRHDRRQERRAYREFLARNPKSKMTFETFQKKYRKGTIKKRNQPEGYVRETEKIKENKKTYGDTVHKFKAAKWTHPNGHPRCLLCGQEESISPECNREPTQEEENAFQEKLDREFSSSRNIRKSRNPLWDGDGVQGIGQPRDRRGRWSDTGGSLRRAAESMGDLGQVMRHTGSTPSRRSGSSKVTAGAVKTAFSKDGLAPGVKINRLRWGPHIMEDKKGNPLQSKSMTPEEALFKRNNGSTALSNADLKRIWENYITKGKLPPKREYDLIVSAGGQLHIDGNVQNIHTRLKSGSKVAKSRGELITMIRSQWSPGSGDRSFKRPDISYEARKRMAAKRRASKKWNSSTQAKKREMLAEIFTYDGVHSVCIFCGEPVLNKAMSLETIKPKSEGGEYTIAHMVPAHKNCNTDANADVLNDPKKYWVDQRKKYMRMYSANIRKKHRAAGGEI